MFHCNLSCRSHFSQVFKGLAYPINGIIMGSSSLDGVFSMLTKQAASLVCVAAMIYMDLTPQGGIDRVWWVLEAFLAIQGLTGIAQDTKAKC
jgi:hypothetical protein